MRDVTKAISECDQIRKQRLVSAGRALAWERLMLAITSTVTRLYPNKILSAKLAREAVLHKLECKAEAIK
jgi:hypothetical protein